MVRVKICGLTNEEDCRRVMELRPDYVGLVFTESSRRVSLEQACKLRRVLGGIKRVALFVNEDQGRVKEVAEAIGANALQFHGDMDKETPEYCAGFLEHWYVWKAMNEKSIHRLGDYASAVDAVVFDASVEGERGGTGQTCDWEQAVRIRESGTQMVLAGGLTSENVAEAIRMVGPWGVDVSSGVEGDVKGRKSYEKMKAFIEAARAA